MKLSGIKLIVVSIVLVSCGKWNRVAFSVSKDMYNYLRVPKDSFFAKYYGDYEFTTTYKRNDKKIVKKIERNFHQKLHLVYIAYTTIPPYYKEYFLRSRKSSRKNKFDSSDIKGQPFLSYSFSYADKNYLLAHFYVGQSFDSAISASWKKEFTEICNSIYMGEHYNNQIQIPDFFKEAANTFSDAGTPNYLAPLRLLDRLSKAYKGIDSQADWMLLQAQLTYHSFLLKGNNTYKNLLKEWRKQTGCVSQEQFLNDKTLRPVSVQSLLVACKQQQVVFFNENHFLPKHRYLVYLLLDSLRSYGFTKLAIEDYRPISKNSFLPSLQDGYYVKEPTMGEIIRKAHDIGMEILSYDAIDRSDREMTSAKKLVEEAFKKDKKTKLLVLCGISHLSEDTTAPKKWMAYYFKKYSGINPYTIDQTSFENYSEWVTPNSIYEKKDDRGFADVYIINNYTPFEKDTLAINLMKDEKVHAFLKEKTKKNQDCSALLYDKKELEKDSINAVPLRSFYLTCTPDSSKIFLHMKSGKYILVIEDEYGNKVEETISF